MLFEGTKSRPDSMAVTKEIEDLGGEINAYTTADRTCFYIKILKKHFDKALALLSDIIKNSTFAGEKIDKERKVILKEIDMVNDMPRTYQWILFTKALFKVHPMKNPTYGTKEVVSKINRKNILDYYNQFYAPNNMVLSVVGNVKDPKNKINQAFTGLKKRPIKQKIYKEPVSSSSTTKVEKRNLNNSYFVLGYKTKGMKELDSYTLDLIQAILSKGQSGKLFDEIRNKRGLAYEVGVLHESSKDYGYFAVYLNADKKNWGKIKELIFQEFNNLKNLTEKEITDAKNYLEGNYALENEDTQTLAEELNYWQMIKDASLLHDYIKNIKKVTKKDIIKAAKKYFTKNYALAIIQQEK